MTRGHAENGEKLGMDFCRSATTRNLAYKIYKVGIFPKSVAGKCPKKFYKDRICLKFQLMVRLGKVRLVWLLV